MTFARRFIGAMTLVSLAGTAFAQADIPALVQAPPEEPVILRAGDTFEIAAETGVEGTTYSWIMTQDRTFIDASRERFFRYRFVNDNVYTLIAEATLPQTGERRRRTFAIEVLPPNAGNTPLPLVAGTGASLAGTVPSPDSNGRVVFLPGQDLLQLTPLRTDITPLAVDFDTATDSDGDGNPGNDVNNVNEDNGFHSFGKPLWIWYARPIEQLELSITAVQQGQSPLIQRISLLSEDAAREQGVLTSPVSIAIETIDDATFIFTPVFANPALGQNALFYEWTFGDGNRSVETAPIHTYASEGPYDVTLNVRDLQTGNAVGSAQASATPVVAPDEPIDEPIDPIDEPLDPEPEPTDPADDESSIDWGRIALIGGLFIGALLLGFALIWLLSFLRKSRKLEETLESMENAVVAPKEQTPPPLAIKSKAQTPPAAAQQKVIDAEINASSSPKEPPAVVVAEKAPDWLKKGLAADGSKVAEASPAPAKPAAAQAPAPAPKPAPVTPPAPKPGPAPAPVTPPAPKPAVPTAPKPTPVAPTPNPPAQASATPDPPDASKMPRWLQTPPAPVAPAQTPAPVAPAPVTPPSAPITPPAAPPAPVAPAPASKPVPAAPQPSIRPAPTPVPPAPKPIVPPAPTPAPAPKPIPVPPAPTPAPVPTPAPQAPAPVTPPPAPTAPIAPAAPVQQTPAQQTPPPAPTNDKGDDDQPIAYIRADNIGPTGPTK